MVKAIFYHVLPEENKSEVDSPYTVLIFIAVISYYMASIFLGMFDTSVTAMMTCVGIDFANTGGDMQFGPEAFDNCFSIQEDEDGNKSLAEGKKKNDVDQDDGF